MTSPGRYYIAWMQRIESRSILERQGPGRRICVWEGARAVRRSWFGSAALTPSFVGAFGCLFEAIGFAVDCDDLGVVDKAIDQGSDAGCGGEDLARFGERAIGGHQGANPNSRHNNNNEVVMAPT